MEPDANQGASIKVSLLLPPFQMFRSMTPGASRRRRGKASCRSETGASCRSRNGVMRGLSFEGGGNYEMVLVTTPLGE